MYLLDFSIDTYVFTTNAVCSLIIYRNRSIKKTFENRIYRNRGIEKTFENRIYRNCGIVKIFEKEIFLS